MAKTSTTLQNRRTAREKIAAKRAAARKRADAEESSLTAFMIARDQRAEAEVNMVAAVIDLVKLGNSTKEIADMTDESPAEINRLRRIAGGSPPTTQDATTEPPIPKQQAGGRAQRAPDAGQSELTFTTDVP
ncbi:hypothetical protein [Amycolatopsis japonica]